MDVMNVVTIRAVRPRRDSNVSSCRNIIRKELLGGLLKSYQRAA